MKGVKMELGNIIEEYKSNKRAKFGYKTYDYVVNSDGLKICIGKRYRHGEDEFKVSLIDDGGYVYFYDWCKRWTSIYCNEINSNKYMEL
jgi:hypothetical protein